MQRALATGSLLFALIGFGWIGAEAQFTGAEPLVLTITPAYPRPYQSVTVVPQSSLIDLAASTVTAAVNGTQVSQGSGAEPIYVSVGGPGTATTISVTAVNNGKTYNKSVTIRPAEVALIVEAQSTAHPFYKGGALTAPQGQVRIVAVPDLRSSGGAAISPSNLVYTWKNGEQVLQDLSGIGKSVLSAVSPVKYRNAPITITVSTQDRTIVAESSVVIAPSDPYIRIYRNDPLLGPLYNVAVPETFTLSGTEESFRAVPYIFSERPAISWQVNNVTSDTDQDITVRASGEGSGKAVLGVIGKGASGQSAGTAVSVEFGGTDSFNFFGL